MDICFLLPRGLGWAAESPSHPYPSPISFTVLLTLKGPAQPATTIMLTSGTTAPQLGWVGSTHSETAPCLTLEFMGALS